MSVTFKANGNGTFVPTYFRSQKRFAPWYFRSLERSFPGTFAPLSENEVKLLLLTQS